jgi:anaerobic magnesium-protoporphyrin IX monomethyl ester cyclase
MQPILSKATSIVIVVPPLRDFYATPHRSASLGAETVRKVLQQYGYVGTLIDGLKNSSRGKQLPLSSGLNHLIPHILPAETGRCSFFTRFQHFGKEYHELVTAMEPLHPDLVFLSCFAYCYSTPALELADHIRKRFPSAVIVAGGAGVSVYPDRFLRRQSIDYTLSGEAEVSLSPFLHYLTGSQKNPEEVPHLGWKTAGKRWYSTSYIHTDSESLLPVLAKTPGRNEVIRYTTSLSRGCPAGCRFCSNHLTHGRKFRHTALEQFENMVKELPEPPAGTEVQFNFEDDNLLYDAPFFTALLTACRKRFPQTAFFAENGLDYRLLTPKRCSDLIAAGFRQFNFTIGSVTPAILADEQRTGNTTHFDRLLTITKNAGVPVISYLICGLPGDTKESVAANLRFLQQRPTAIGMSMFYPVPGLPGFEDRSLFDAHPPQRCAGSSAWPWCGSVDTDTLVTAFRLARFINLCKAPNVTEEEQELITLTLQHGKLFTVIREHRERRIIEVPGQDEELVRMVVAN